MKFYVWSYIPDITKIKLYRYTCSYEEGVKVTYLKMNLTETSIWLHEVSMYIHTKKKKMVDMYTDVKGWFIP